MARDRRDLPRESRVDQPLGRSPRPSVDPDLFGRASERIARFIGSWRFIAWMTLFVITWMLWNTLAPDDLAFDEWPFIGLTLILSLQASYAAPLILLAQNRQADRDRVQYLEDRDSTMRLVDDSDYISRELAALRQSIGEIATREFIQKELREQLARRDDDETAEADDAEPVDRP